MHPLLESSARHLNTHQLQPGPIVYWMSRDQRAHNNKALLFAQDLALQNHQPLLVVFAKTKVRFANQRAYDFLDVGLAELQNTLGEFNIPFFVLRGEPEKVIVHFAQQIRAGAIVCDSSPLRGGRKWREKVATSLTLPVIEVDAHNIVPVWLASPKQEFAARTLRPKLERVLETWLKPLPELKKHPHEWKGEKPTNFTFHDSVESGEKAAQKHLSDFLEHRLAQYDRDRNDPGLDGQSHLSAFLHFGQLSALELALKVQSSQASSSAKADFLEELIVRRELAENYCWYNPHYDSFAGFPDWAKKTLNKHRADRREYLYSLEELEHAKTHDELWNAAQMEMVKTGRMHGYMRMYWAKKILEWTDSPEQAQAFAIQLNDTYELDGRDPNGYTGIAWSIGGVHDRPWFDRPIFGSVRYMSGTSLSKKFDTKTYLQRIRSL